MVEVIGQVASSAPPFGLRVGNEIVLFEDFGAQELVQLIVLPDSPAKVLELLSGWLRNHGNI